MDSLRKWLNKPKADDKSLLARFYHADRALTAIASELDSFDGRTEPVRCTRLVSRLRQGQDRVLAITNQIMDELLCDDRAPRAFRVKFPEEVLQESLAGQLWFGAECLAAGSSILNREAESAKMRPLAKAVTKSLEIVRNRLREQCLRNNIPNSPTLRLDFNDAATEQLYESLKIFDRLFAEFELVYVSAMVQVKTKQEYEMQELICVLFSETLQRALKTGLLEQEQVDSYDPALMFSIPRLAIIAGLVIFREGPLNMDQPADNISEMFRPFRKLLIKMRDLLHTLTKHELYQLEKLLCTNEEIHMSDQLICDEERGAGAGAKEDEDVHEPMGESSEHVVIVTTTTVTTSMGVGEGDKQSDTGCGGNPASSAHVVRQTFGVGAENGTGSSSSSSSSSSSANNSSVGGNSTTKRTRNRHNQHLVRQHSHSAQVALPTITFDDGDDHREADLTEEEEEDNGTSARHENNEDDNDDDSDDDERHNEEETDEETSSKNPLAMTDCASGYLIPNTNFGNLLQTNEAPLTDSFIATDDELRLLNIEVSQLEVSSPTTRANIESILAVAAGEASGGVTATAPAVSDPPPTTESDSGHGTGNHSTDMSPELDTERAMVFGGVSSSAMSKNSTATTLGRSRSASLPKTSKKPSEISESSSDYDDDDDEEEADVDDPEDDVDADDDEDDEEDVVNSVHGKKEGGDMLGKSRAATAMEAGSGQTAKHPQHNHHRKQSHHRPRASTSAAARKPQSSSHHHSHSNHHHHHHPSYSDAATEVTTGPNTTTTANTTISSGNGRYSRSHQQQQQQQQQPQCVSSSSCDTSPTQSECSDAHEVALAIRAAGRNKFKTTENLLHRLFVCIAGVADQLQTNFAADLRKMLKSVFIMNSSPPEPEEPPEASDSEEKSKASQHPSDLFEFRASEQDVITADQNHSGGSSQSIYSAEEANPEQDSVFASSGDSSPVRRTASVESGNVTVNVSVSVVTSSPGGSGGHTTGGVAGTRSAQERSVSLSEACIVVEGGKPSTRRHSASGSKGDYGRSRSSPSSPINSNSNGNGIPGSIHSTTSSSGRDLHLDQQQQQQHQRRMPEEPPRWIPDCDAPRCMSCASAFTPFRRRHHCRNCGGVFCGVCSNLSAPLPKYGLTKAVRVCRDCFIREVGT